MTRDWSSLAWREKTWGERSRTLVIWILASIIGLATIAIALFVVNESLIGISRYSAQHTRCLRNATNGYEIKQCRW